MDLHSIDIAADEVSVGGHTLSVHGLSLSKVSSLLRQYPALLSLLDGKSVEIGELLAAAPDGAVAIMMAGLKKDDKKTEAWLDDLPISEQFDIASAILGRTFQGNVRPFLGLAVSLIKSAPSASAETKASAEKSPEPSSN